MKRPKNSVLGRIPSTGKRRTFASVDSEQGSTLVEFAIVAVLFMTVLFGISGFGYALYAYHYVGNAARDASRWAAVNGYNCATDASCNGTNGMNSGPAKSGDIINYVSSRAPAGINPAQLTTSVTWPVQADGPSQCNSATTYNYPGCTVQVQVTYTFNFPFPLVSRAIKVSSTSQMIIAH